jgi:flagellar export protein FliJ
MNIAALKTYRAQLEDVLRIEVERLAQRLREMESRRACLEAEADATARAYAQRTRFSITAREALDQYETLEGLARSIRHAERAAAAVREEWERKRQELWEAARERRKLELLDQRDQRRRRRADAQQEQRVIDEIAARRPPK